MGKVSRHKDHFIDTGHFIDVVFDGPPGHDGGRFIEVENEDGVSVRVGEWVDRKDGTWALRLRSLSPWPEEQ